MDHRWFVDVHPSVARERLAARHLAAGIVSTIEEGFRRADESDFLNAEEIRQYRVAGCKLIHGSEDRT